MEANKSKRDRYTEFIRWMNLISLVYIDESGIDMNICKERGWGERGYPLYGKRSGKYYQRTNIIAGLIDNKPIAPMVFSGSCNTEVFNKWVEEFLIKEL